MPTLSNLSAELLLLIFRFVFDSALPVYSLNALTSSRVPPSLAYWLNGLIISRAIMPAARDDLLEAYHARIVFDLQERGIDQLYMERHRQRFEPYQLTLSPHDHQLRALTLHFNYLEDYLCGSTGCNFFDVWKFLERLTGLRKLNVAILHTASLTVSKVDVLPSTVFRLHIVRILENLERAELVCKLAPLSAEFGQVVDPQRHAL